MRLVTFANGDSTAAGLSLAGGRVCDLQALGNSDWTTVLGFIQAGPEAWEKAKGLTPAQQEMFMVENVELRAPIPRPAKNVFCVGRNYLGHVHEGYRARGLPVDVPQAPQFFSKPPTTVVGPQARIYIDTNVSDRMDYEVELGVVIGRTGRNIAPEDAFEHVFGFTIINDVTARDLQRKHEQWFKGKGLDGTCPMGPCIVSLDEIADLAGLKLELSVNGQVRQSATVSQMIFDIPTIICELSKGMTLEAGDIIATGTPEGVGYAMTPPSFLKDGDEVICRIEGIGELKNRVVQREAA